MHPGRPEILERINRSAILQLIREQPGISRVELGCLLYTSDAADE